MNIIVPQRFLLAVALCAAAASLRAADPAPQTVFHVATTGDDKNAGTAASPFATLARAQGAVRELAAAGLKADVTVLVRGGRYQLAEPLLFGPADSGTKEFSITYAAHPNEKVLISGGRLITGWQKTEKGLWQAEVPEVKAGHWYFRDFYVNDQRATRARKPNVTDREPYFRIQASTLSDDQATWTIFLPKNCAAQWKNLSDVELITIQTFQTIRKSLLNVNNLTGAVLLQPPHLKLRHSYLLPSVRSRCYLENALAFLDQPGEWYLDRSSGELRYWPRDGEDLNNAVTTGSAISRLVEVKGAPGRPVRNLHFRGMTFSHTAWPLPKVGYMGAQATLFYGDKFPQPPQRGREANLWERLDAAVSFEFAESCSVQGCEITHVGGTGIQLRRGCVKNLVQGNHLFDTAGNAVMVGEGLDCKTTPNAATAAEIVSGNQISNNHLHSCGAVYPEGVGIWVGLAENTLVAHNLLHDLSYTGISVGWEWGGNESTCANNTILNNHVHHAMEILDDGAAIYTLGKQPGTVIRGNVVHDISARWGLYLDEGSQNGFLIEDNFILGTSGWPVKNAFGITWRGGHTWRNNTFAAANTFAPGVVGSGLLFEKDIFLEAPHDPKLEPQQLTVEAWVKFTELPKGKDPSVWIACKNSNEFTDGHYALLVSQGNVGAYVNVGGGRDNCFASWSASHPILTNAWNHLAMTYDGRELKVYHNGQLQHTTLVARPRTAGTGALRIGKRTDDYNPAFQGLMDEIHIYNRALSANEIATHHAQPAALSPQQDPTLVAAWSFDDLRERSQQAITHAGPVEPYRTRLGLTQPNK